MTLLVMKKGARGRYRVYEFKTEERREWFTETPIDKNRLIREQLKNDYAVISLITTIAFLVTFYTTIGW
jgi:hypothetical protein